MNWTADYNLLLNDDESALDLKGWVTLDNHSGRAFNDARLKLVAGDLNRIEPPQPVFAESRAMAMDMAQEQAPRVEQRELFEYQLYEVARSVSIKDNETKQIEFVSWQRYRGDELLRLQQFAAVQRLFLTHRLCRGL